MQKVPQLRQKLSLQKIRHVRPTLEYRIAF